MCNMDRGVRWVTWEVWMGRRDIDRVVIWMGAVVADIDEGGEYGMVFKIDEKVLTEG